MLRHARVSVVRCCAWMSLCGWRVTRSARCVSSAASRSDGSCIGGETELVVERADGVLADARMAEEGSVGL